MMAVALAPKLLAFAFGPLGMPELIVIVLIIFLLFGAKKVPEIMKSFAQGVREFKRESNRIVSDIESAVESDPEPQPTSSKTSD
ncbi:MAG: twin-arginine translocase TatA/TatE family subunit [Armatimonadota bacterium]